jgi:hypothetical protein
VFTLVADVGKKILHLSLEGSQGTLMNDGQVATSTSNSESTLDIVFSKDLHLSHQLRTLRGYASGTHRHLHEEIMKTKFALIDNAASRSLLLRLLDALKTFVSGISLLYPLVVHHVLRPLLRHPNVHRSHCSVTSPVLKVSNVPDL